MIEPADTKYYAYVNVTLLIHISPPALFQYLSLYLCYLSMI